MDLAPIVLFTYNRPWHTQQTLDALAKNQLACESELFIFADGPKDNASPETLQEIQEVRAIAHAFKGCKQTTIVESEINKGLANSVIEGVTKIVNEYGTIIVLEDDIVTSPYFLSYMNQGLKLYENNQNVYSINGFMFDIEFGNNFETFLCPWATCSWGWATWKVKWAVFEEAPTYKKEIQQNKFLASRFNLADYDYATMLNNKNSWAIRWYYSVFSKNGLGIWPTKSLVTNIGFDNSGVHKHADFIQKNIYNNNIELHIQESINFEKYDLLLQFFTIKPSVRKQKNNFIKNVLQYVFKN